MRILTPAEIKAKTDRILAESQILISAMDAKKRAAQKVFDQENSTADRVIAVATEAERDATAAQSAITTNLTDAQKI